MSEVDDVLAAWAATLTEAERAEVVWLLDVEEDAPEALDADE
jgi:hypothetical protein